jgi:hypothetical protein
MVAGRRTGVLSHRGDGKAHHSLNGSLAKCGNRNRSRYVASCRDQRDALQNARRGSSVPLDFAPYRRERLLDRLSACLLPRLSASRCDASDAVRSVHWRSALVRRRIPVPLNRLGLSAGAKQAASNCDRVGVRQSRNFMRNCRRTLHRLCTQLCGAHIVGFGV